MYRNLNPAVLGGVAVRQSELIELTLSYGFAGFTMDLSDFESQLKHGSLEHAGRLIASAKLQIGAFELPIDWSGNDESFAIEKGKLIHLAKAASDIGGKLCRVTIPPANDERPYHEEFEFCRKRMTEIGVVLAEQDIKLALCFQAPAALRDNFAFQFIHTFDELSKLVDGISQPNVGICVDTWQWYHGGGDLNQLEALASERVFAVDLSDSSEEASNETADETARRLPGTTGKIDTLAVLKWLGGIEFDGPLTPVADSGSLSGFKRNDILQRTKNALVRQLVEAELSNEPLPPADVDPIAAEELTTEEPAADTVAEAKPEAEAESAAEVAAAES